MTNEGILIGWLTAYVGSDMGYSTRVEVGADVSQDVTTYTVKRWETAPSGGMDGPREGSNRFGEVTNVLHDPSARELARAVKAVFDDTVKRYGKPAKSFNWRSDDGTVKGMDYKTVLNAQIWAENRREQ